MLDRRLGWMMAIVTLASLVVLLVQTREKMRAAPPIPRAIVTADGTTLMTAADILEGRTIWRSIGGQEFGSVWGQGSAIAPDWSADWVHREAILIRDHIAYDTFGSPFAELTPYQQARVEPLLIRELRTNTYNPETGELVVSDLRAEVASQISRHVTSIFMDDESARQERKALSIPRNAVKEPRRMAAINAFFFWSAWACVTERPDSRVSYTNNWPTDPLVGNDRLEPFEEANIEGLIFFLVGAAVSLVFYYSMRGELVPASQAQRLPWREPSDSMRATSRYFWLVGVLLVLQTLIGALSSQPGIASWFPSSLLRSWYSELGAMWSLTAFVALGLFLAPLLSGAEPKRQCLLVRWLFDSLVIIMAGVLLAQSLAVVQRLGAETVDLNRFLLGLFGVAVLAGLGLIVRALRPLWARDPETQRLALTYFATAVVGVFVVVMVGGLGYSALATHWVESAFRLFATGLVGFVCVRLGLLHRKLAGALIKICAIFFLAQSVFRPESALSFSFDALQRLPLALIGLESWLRFRSAARARAEQGELFGDERWPIQFLIAAAFWNMIGSHTTLIGVYAMIGMSLLLLAFERMAIPVRWKESVVLFAFWTINVGLALRVFAGVWPATVLQALASRSRGDWWARSGEFLQQPLLIHFRSMRTVGDAVFLTGCFALIWMIWKETHRGEIPLPTPRR